MIAALPSLENNYYFCTLVARREVCWKPLPRKAAGTLGASGGQRNRKRLKANTCSRSERAEQEKYQSEIRCKKSENFN